MFFIPRQALGEGIESMSVPYCKLTGYVGAPSNQGVVLRGFVRVNGQAHSLEPQVSRI